MNRTVRKRQSKSSMGVLYYVIFAILVFVFVGSAIYLIRYYGASKKSEDLVDDLRELTATDSPALSEMEKTEDKLPELTESEKEKKESSKYMAVDGVSVLRKYAALYQKNHDFVGWLTIPDTVIDYPVMYTPHNEEYYLRRDFDGNYSEAGTLFIDTDSDYKKPSDNVLIYGHNMNSGKMFHDLLKYEDEEFYKNHKQFTFDTIREEGTYEVIAAFRTVIYPETDTVNFKYYTFFNADTPKDFDIFVKNVKALTPYRIDTTAEYGDLLLTLSTCAYHDENGRYVVVAKKITNDEEKK